MDGKKIVIVEDNELNLRLFCDLLQMKGAEVISIKDGKEFFKKICTIQPHLVLMDIQLQDISGLDLIKEIKSQELTKDIPVIAVTAFAMKDDAKKILNSGCDAYISKPFSIEYFFSVINKLVMIRNNSIE